MKTETLKNRFAKFNGSKNSKAYQIVRDWIERTNKTYMVFNNHIYPCHTSGRGRYTTNLDYTDDVKAILDFLKIRYIANNDSPRGGLTGNYIHIITKIL